MNDHLIGGYRRTPLHEPATATTAPENTPETNVVQLDAAETVDLQQRSAARLEDYTISVQEVREYLKAKGVAKSKDTI